MNWRWWCAICSTSDSLTHSFTLLTFFLGSVSAFPTRSLYPLNSPALALLCNAPLFSLEVIFSILSQGPWFFFPEQGVCVCIFWWWGGGDYFRESENNFLVYCFMFCSLKKMEGKGELLSVELNVVANISVHSYIFVSIVSYVTSELINWSNMRISLPISLIICIQLDVRMTVASMSTPLCSLFSCFFYNEGHLMKTKQLQVSLVQFHSFFSPLISE